MQAVHRAAECFSTRAFTKHAAFIPIRHLIRHAAQPNETVRAAIAGDFNEGSGASFAHAIDPWFFLVSILYAPRANFHAGGMAGRLTRPAERGPLAGHLSHMQGGTGPDNALFQGELVPGWPVILRDTRGAARIVLPRRMEDVPLTAFA